MEFDFKDRIVVVTGAARGIGKNIARHFRQSGAKVIVADTNNKQGLETIQELSAFGVADYVDLDLRDQKKFDPFLRDIFDKHGRIDVLINNARAGERTAGLQETEGNFDLTISVSLKAPLFLSQSLIHLCKDLGMPCSIINISSIAATNICGESASYHIAKAGIESLTRYLAFCAGPYGIRVNAIRPGFIVQDEHQSRFRQEDNAAYRDTAEFSSPLRKTGTSDDIAGITLFLCSEYATFITGQVINVDGGLQIQDQFSLLMDYQKHRS